jgi:polyhydroxyalkanoate synthesis regulator phasin
LSSITADDVVKLFEGDVRARKRLAELLVSEPDVRLAIINAVLRDVATKSDIESLKAATKSDIEALRTATKSDVEALRKELKGDIEALKVATKSDIEALRSATKSDVEALRKEIEALRAATKSDMEALRKEFKSDLESLRKEFKEEMGRLDGRINGLDQRVARLEGSISLFTKLFIAFNLPLLVSVIAALVALLLRAH